MNFKTTIDNKFDFQTELKTDDQQVPVQVPVTEKKRGRPRKIKTVILILNN